MAMVSLGNTTFFFFKQLKKRFYFLNHVHACVSVCVQTSAGAHGGQKRVSDPWERELQTVVGSLR